MIFNAKFHLILRITLYDNRFYEFIYSQSLLINFQLFVNNAHKLIPDTVRPIIINS